MRLCCRLCRKEFTWRKWLPHIKRVRKDAAKRHRCSICCVAFKHARKLARHEASVKHREAAQLAPGKIAWKFECVRCNYRTQARRDWERHVATVRHNLPEDYIPTRRTRDDGTVEYISESVRFGKTGWLPTPARQAAAERLGRLAGGDIRAATKKWKSMSKEERRANKESKKQSQYGGPNSGQFGASRARMRELAQAAGAARRRARTQTGTSADAVPARHAKRDCGARFTLRKQQIEELKRARESQLKKKKEARAAQRKKMSAQQEQAKPAAVASQVVCPTKRVAVAAGAFVLLE